MNKSITLCLPGAEYSSAWVTHFAQLQGYLLSRDWDVKAAFGYTNNIYITRGSLTAAVLREDPMSELVLWIDDDNLLSVQCLVKLIDDLEAHPEADLVCGWYWIAADVAEGQLLPCVGRFNEKLHMEYASQDLLKMKSPFEIDWCGFGSVLMRSSALKKAGDKPFAPIMGEQWPLGYTGDDISFCLNLFNRGGKMLCDPEVFVPHLKLRAVQCPHPIEMPKEIPDAVEKAVAA